MSVNQQKSPQIAQREEQVKKKLKASPKLRRVVHENTIKAAQKRHSWNEVLQ